MEGHRCWGEGLGEKKRGEINDNQNDRVKLNTLYNNCEKSKNRPKGNCAAQGCALGLEEAAERKRKSQNCQQYQDKCPWSPPPCPHLTLLQQWLLAEPLPTCSHGSDSLSCEGPSLGWRETFVINTLDKTFSPPLPPKHTQEFQKRMNHVCGTPP